MIHHAVLLLLSLTCAILAKDISRSKRQLRSYYMCGGYGNGYISNTACGNYNGCGTNCGGSAAMIIPNSFYAPSTNCQTSCSNVNCNQFNGQYINGQYVAVATGNGQYSPCASSCCSGWNNWNSGSWPAWGNSVVISGNSNDYYNPYTTNTNAGSDFYNPYYNPLTQYFCAVVLNRLADHVLGMASVRRGTSAWQAMCAADVLWEPAQVSRGLTLTVCINGSCPDGHACGKACPCTNCQPSCQYRCSTTMYCQTINVNWVCRNGCCAENHYNPYPPITTTTATPTIRPNPLCEGREASAGYCQPGGSCPSGFICTPSNVCCRCAYGTSIGPCVNSQCPDNFQCNMNNECCPYQVGR
ncbi:hypothetical protein Aduo_016715 [Ancylostoma duodenale]